MARGSEVLAVLRLGTTETTVALAEFSDRVNESPRPLILASEPTKGIRKGRVIDITQVSETISAVCEAAEQQADMDIHNLYVVYSGVDLATQISQGSISFPGRGETIGDEAMERVHEQATNGLEYAETHVAINHLPLTYQLDNLKDISNPYNMMGSRLKVDMLNLSVPAGAAHNVMSCVANTGRSVSGLLPKGLVVPMGAMTHDEWAGCSLCVSIGGGSTSMTLVKDNRILAMKTLGYGGGHVTNDLVETLRVPFGLAEELKKRINLDPSVPTNMPVGFEKFPVDEAREVIFCRLEEMLQCHVAPFVDECASLGAVTTVVFEGGVCNTPGFVQLAEQILNLPVRLASGYDFDGRKISPVVLGAFSYLWRKSRYPFYSTDCLVGQGLSSGESETVAYQSHPKEPSKLAARSKGFFSRLWQSIKELF